MKNSRSYPLVWEKTHKIKEANEKRSDIFTLLSLFSSRKLIPNFSFSSKI
jgi:hypothetical protein